MFRIKAKTRLSVGQKIILLLALSLIFTSFTIALISSKLFREDNTALIEQMNFHEANSIAKLIRGSVQMQVSRLENLNSFLQANPSNQNYDLAAVKTPELLGNIVFKMDSKPPQIRLSIFKNDEVKEKMFRQLEQFKHSNENSVVVIVRNEPGLGLIFYYFLPVGEGDMSGLYSVSMVSAKEITSILKESDGNIAYLITKEGKIVSHPTLEIDSNGNTVPEKVFEIFNTELVNMQVNYTGSDGLKKLASVRKIGIGELALIVEVPQSIAFEASRRVVKISILFAFVVFCFALFLGAIFSGFLVAPIKVLTEAAKKITDGEFSVRIEVPAKNGDEIANFAKVFNSMAIGLEERERYRDTFVKFHSKEVADTILSGKVSLGGEKRDAIILFIDLRNFTSECEKLTPQQAVEMLNEYLSTVVKIIRKNKGVIDKFVGDAIMATWGVPIEHESDAEDAVRACQEIRDQLLALNHKRLSRGQSEFRVGMGLNLGSVIAGNIGSDERMEYTVIGDAVNIASRLESKTKDLETDILVSENIRDKVKGRFSFDAGTMVSLKGKAEQLKAFRLT